MERPLLFALLVVIGHLSLGQSSPTSKKYQNKSLLEIVQELQSKGLKFSYDPSKLEKISIDLEIQASNDEELIKKIFKDLPFKIKRARDVYLIIPDQEKKKKSFLSGQVFDANTGQPLAFAHIKTHKAKGTISNPSGNFTLDTHKDSTLVTISYLGYKQSELWVKPIDSKQLIIQLEPDSKVLQEFIITPQTGFDTISRGVSTFSINPNQISSLPSLGETDVFKSLQLLPGVSATDETNSGLIVRGSPMAENLVLLDGFTIYHLDHFFGIFSTFNPNTIGQLDIYKGAFGPQFGGRTSSVVDASAKLGTHDGFQGGFGFNTISFNGYLETPIGKKMSLIMGLRRSYYDLIENGIYADFIETTRTDPVQANNPEVEEEGFEVEPTFNFYDFNAKLRFSPTDDQTLDLNIYLSEDFYEGEVEDGDEFYKLFIKDEANWSNAGMSLVWQKNWSPKSFSDIVLSVSGFSSQSNYAISESFDLGFFDDDDAFDTTTVIAQYDKSNEIADFSLKWRQELMVDEANQFHFGLEANTLSTNLEVLFFDDKNSFESEAFVFAYYGNYLFHKGKFSSQAGLRANYYDQLDEWYAEPRLNVRYQLLDNIHLKGGWSRHHQYMHQTTLSQFGNSDQFYWVLSDGIEYPVIKSTHLVSGFEYRKGKWLLDVEAYSKKTTGITESESVIFAPYNGLDFERIDDFRLDGENQAEGIDFLLKYQDRQYGSWLSYSLSRSENSIPIVNRSLAYPSGVDQRHEVNWSQTFKWHKWEFSTVFIYGSGLPYTPRGGFFEEEPVLYDINRINSRRLPDYHRLDISGKFNFQMKKVNGEVGLTIFNLYNRTNIKSRRFGFSTEYDPDLDDFVV
ncbi:MAG: carboxypeptidase-like regulatory domain-containing protein, partial [Cyclobacteriaceae bacterium]|nr:carboxypeptidase-like regulatory domain-containing protein [Cyclobacteriaceae bacterium HetDA_MAG_MS6]